MDSDELSRGNFEVGFRPQQSVKAGRERQPEAHGTPGSAQMAPWSAGPSCARDMQQRPALCSAPWRGDASLQPCVVHLACVHTHPFPWAQKPRLSVPGLVLGLGVQGG